MTVSRLFRRALEVPPHVAVRKAVQLGFRQWRRLRHRQDDRRTSTFGPVSGDPSAAQPLPTFLTPWSLELLRSRGDEVRALSRHFLAHRFDWLGSGWTQVRHGVACRGQVGAPHAPAAWAVAAQPTVVPDEGGRWLEGRINSANLGPARHRWQQVSSPEYQPIDWQLDFKSGYRWRESQWYLDQDLFPQRGTDVKVPWELARMQHLPWLVAAYQLASAGDAGFEAPAAYREEFQNQVADFLATNPPRFGVNWCCAMDVALRAASWLVTYDLFRGAGASFSPGWESIFQAGLRDHARYLIRHLEWDPVVRGNHYLSDLCGLIYLSAYLPIGPELPSSEVEGWLRLGVGELLTETQLQFYPDGANFEASTSYHRLSAEMVAQATLLLHALPKEKSGLLTRDRASGVSDRVGPVPIAAGVLWPLPRAHQERLRAVRDFSRSVSVGKGGPGWAPLVGDDDNGAWLRWLPPHEVILASEASTRFAHLLDYREPSLDERYWHELPLGHDNATESIGYLLGDTTPSGAIRLPSRGDGAGSSEVTDVSMRDVDELDHVPFPEGGMYVWRTADAYLLVRCGSNGQNGNGGHAHNDQLSFSFALLESSPEGVQGPRACPIIIDPGTFLYSPAVEARNLFRSTRAHSTLSRNGAEQNEWRAGTEGLFRLEDRAHARVERVSETAFVGRHEGLGCVHTRELRLEDGVLYGRDTVDAEGSLELCFPLAPELSLDPSDLPDGVIRFLARNGRALTLSWKQGAGSVEESTCSPAYGRLRRNYTVRIVASAREVQWRLQWVTA